ncbi:MAG: sensor histidine kinase, partial [Bacteroidota bacterium]
MKKISDKELLQELKRRFEENNLALGELKKVNKELKEVNKKLEASESLKSHFISNITNEIINPFTSIIGLSKSILSVNKEDWKKVISMVALIHSEAFNLDFQLKNIFVAAKIEAGEIFPEINNVDVKNLMENVIDSFRLEAKKKKITIKYHFEVQFDTNTFCFKTDSEKLKLIMSNLLNNAIKFSNEGDMIDVTMKSSSEGLEISVKDYGVGISLENQKIIFDRFSKTDPGINSVHPGHGLGLSINKALLDILGGKIKV